MLKMSKEEILKTVNTGYDFTLDTKSDNYKSKKLDNIDRYFIYKMKLTKLSLFNDDEEIRNKVASYKGMYAGINDPDSHSIALQNIYIKLWPKDLLEKPYMKYKNRYLADTMTSCTTTLNAYLNRKYKKIVTNKSAIIEYLHNKENLKKIVKEDENVYNFLSYYHTLGNFIPVPIGFNVSRSNYGRHDYWDLTLKKIKDWYDNSNDLEKQNKIVLELLHNNVKYVNNCTKWLEYFETWVNFIDVNYLKNYIDDNDEVIRFSKNHTWNNPVVDLDEFYNNINKVIEERTEIMLDKLKNI